MRRALFASALLGTALAQDQTAETATVKVDFIGASGGMKLFPKADDKSFIMVQQGKLAEIDAKTGKTVKDIKMAGQNEPWTPVAEEGEGDKVVYSTSFSKTTATGNFGLSAFLTRTTTTVTETVACDGCTTETEGQLFECKDAGNVCSAATDGACADGSTLCEESSTVTEDSLKFSIRVSGWEFADPANTLQYEVSLKSKAGGKEAEESSEGKGKRVDVDGGYVTMPTTATIHGGAASKDVDVTVTTGTQGQAATITYTFPSFAADEELWYDPKLFINSGGLVVPSAMALAGCVVAALGLAQ